MEYTTFPGAGIDDFGQSTPLLSGGFLVKILMRASRFNIMKFTTFSIRGGVEKEKHP